jgi:hypothetical protein
MKAAGIGFRTKTGRAIVVAVSVEASAPVVVLRREILLHDPKVPATFQPHHEVMDLPWPEAQRAASLFERSIEKIAAAGLKELSNELRDLGFGLSGVGVVGSSDRNLEKIGNFHIRAHAAEGILFRRVVETAAGKNKLPWRGFSDRDILQKAADALGMREEKLGTTLKMMGKAAGSPWRQDERAAAAAAWVVMRK